MKTSKFSKKTSSLTKITVAILIASFLLTVTGTVITLFTPGYFDSFFSSFSSGADLVRKALYFLLCAVLFVALIPAILGNKRGYTAFILCCIATVNFIDLFCVRPLIFKLSGALLSSLQIDGILVILVRLHITLMISALAALIMGGFEDSTLKSGFVIAVLTSLCMLSNLLFWVDHLEKAAADILRGDFT